MPASSVGRQWGHLGVCGERDRSATAAIFRSKRVLAECGGPMGLLWPVTTGYRRPHKRCGLVRRLARSDECLLTWTELIVSLEFPRCASSWTTYVPAKQQLQRSGAKRAFVASPKGRRNSIQPRASVQIHALTLQRDYPPEWRDGDGVQSLLA